MKLPLDSDFNTDSRKFHVVTVLQSFFAFYIASLSFAVFFMYRGEHWLFTAIIMGILYLFILIVSLKRILNRLSLAALMLLIPIAPFAVLATLLSFIPVMQLLHH